LIAALGEIPPQTLGSEDVAIWAAVGVEDSIYAVVTQAQLPSALVVLEEGKLTGFHAQAGVWTDESVGAVGSQRESRVVWIGLPFDAALAQLTLPDGSVFLQRPIEGTAFFAIPKPTWNQLASLTALDADGRPLISDEVSLDGGGCSAFRLRPTALFQRDLPDLVAETRDRLVGDSVRCAFSSIESLVDSHSGGTVSYRDSDWTGRLRELDRVHPVMQHLWSALHNPFEIRTVPGGSDELYVWSADTDGGVIAVSIAPDGTVSIDIEET
jgi:hypothetical protein